MVGQQRHLIVTADDFGIGPATSEGILDAAAAGAVTASVLLVNSPHAESAVRSWRQHGCPMELGWHANLTLDAPVLAAAQVPSLTRPNGTFWPLGDFLQRWLLGKLRQEHIELELHAQLRRFRDLMGRWPIIVNSHQHLAVFAPVGQLLLDVLQRHDCHAFVRRVRESVRTLWTVRGARFKRILLHGLGRQFAFAQTARQFPGSDCLAGITDPKYVQRPGFFEHWLRAAPGRVVELMCHPGHFDATLPGRDCQAGDGNQQRRVVEWCLLRQPQFREAVRAAGFTLTVPSQLVSGGSRHVQAA